ncbi:hypothetical protein TNCV_4978781 [Trichonephila clavipes]|nr:hypothetical protein TNCV_4978781 [Trichonephila clavipes]
MRKRKTSSFRSKRFGLFKPRVQYISFNLSTGAHLFGIFDLELLRHGCIVPLLRSIPPSTLPLLITQADQLIVGICIHDSFELGTHSKMSSSSGLILIYCNETIGQCDRFSAVATWPWVRTMRSVTDSPRVVVVANATCLAEPDRATVYCRGRYLGVALSRLHPQHGGTSVALGFVTVTLKRQPPARNNDHRDHRGNLKR